MKNMVTLAQFTRKFNLPKRSRRFSDMRCNRENSFTGGLTLIELLLFHHHHLLLLLSLLVTRCGTFTRGSRR